VTSPIARRVLAEFIGTGFLVAAVIGSGIAATRLSPTDVGLQLLENAIVTGAALVALILALQPVSAAFNPIVTLVERALGAIDTRVAAALIAAQFVGGFVGAVVANLMFDLDAISISHHVRSAHGLWLGEVVATIGLLVIIFGTVRSGRTERVAFAVGGYITAAYWFTSSTSFANPAVAVARMFSDSFAGIAPASVPAFVVAQLLGGVFGYLLVRALYPSSGVTTMPANTPIVLFVCVHNAGRSQMAAGWLSHLAGGRIEVRSAGSEPADQINPVAVAAMREAGIDITRNRPKLLTTDAVRTADVVITMGCGDTCPIFPGKRYEDWDVADPAGQPIDVVRGVRDDIRERVEQLVRELTVVLA
jgi:arsenate reductase